MSQILLAKESKNENAYHRSLTDEHEGHIDLIDSTLTTLVPQAALLPLLNRIAALEAQAQNRNDNVNSEPQLSDEELKRYRRQERNASDMYFILTIKFKGFAPPCIHQQSQEASEKSSGND